MIKFWVKQTDNNIINDGDRIAFQEIQEKNVQRAEKFFGKIAFSRTMLNYSDFSIIISFFRSGNYKGNNVNYIVWKPDDGKSWYINMRYQYDNKRIIASYRDDFKGNHDSKVFKNYMSEFSSKNGGLQFDINELGLRDSQPNDNVKKLFDYFHKMIHKANKYTENDDYGLPKRENVATFVMPSNSNKYDATSAFNDLLTVNWGQNNNKSVKIGDIIYIYESKPAQRLILKTQVIDRDVTKHYIDDSQYAAESTSFGRKGPWFSLRLVENINVEINLQVLKNWGLKGNIQSLRQLDDDIIKRIEYICSLDTDLTTIARLEGHKKEIYTTKYERNPQNRAKALAYQGYTCKACGFNFEKTYGDIGKFFIEVHHVIPLFSLDEEIRVDPQKDLVPLCSNCHRMIHRNKTKMISVSELSRIINSNK